MKRSTIIFISIIALFLVSWLYVDGNSIAPFAQSQLMEEGRQSAETITETESDWLIPCDSLFEQQQIPVLMYHHILPEEKNPFPENPAVLDLEIFKEHMHYLYMNEYTTLTLNELKQFIDGELTPPQNSVVITFDDGYASEHKYVAPVLREYGFNAVSFLITSLVETETQPFRHDKLVYLSWEQIYLNSDVFEYGGHTHNLHWLNDEKSSLVTSSSQTIHSDLFTSTKLLPVSFFAYPYGHYNETVIEIAQKHGYTLAFTTEETHIVPGSDPMKAGRYAITPFLSMEAFIEILNPSYR